MNEFAHAFDTPFVSVIIPCHNAEATIVDCVESLKCQDYLSYEIILVDDNSSDSTYHLMEGVEGITLLRNEVNHGPAYSRNKAIEASRGELYLLIDSDCLVEDPQLISKHVDAHRESSAHLIGGGIKGIGKGCVAKADNYSHWFLNIPYSANKVSTHLVTTNMSFRKEVFEKIGAFDVKLRTGEDTDFCERAKKAGYRLGLYTEAVVKHHDRENLRDFLRCFYLVGIDRIPVRKHNNYPYSYLLPSNSVIALLYFLPLSVLLTLQVIVTWLRYDLKVIWYTPLIFAGRLSMCYGIVSYCFGRRNPGIGGKGCEPT